ncbi:MULTISPECIES: Rap1a/Tai family immunity protein [unclassified Rhizobium]|uniref:Rap1a/Tai family immunity protein n=1 Tax=unclassified Rhizobium TaxID=2613769 RepID=UPI00115D574E|nr:MULTISPECIES: Rap1a/Tai family immunity protein [unclassified Rhizobium]TQX90243.1 hypothetical protein EQW76_11105 [Rhizobium sp. rho-13.1]TQY16193.1 hypothetical protein EQW74_10695 [Rhizobium sp. rho-1.1]
MDIQASGAVQLLKFLIAALVVSIPTSGICQYLSGNDMNAICKQEGRVAVNHFVMAVADTSQALLAGPKAPRLYCLAKGVTAGQLGDVFCKYLQENPEHREKAAAGLAMVAFINAWPCH